MTKTNVRNPETLSTQDNKIEDCDPYDPGRFRISQNFDTTATTLLEESEVVVARPGKQEFIRVHPDPEYRLDAAVIDFDGKKYLVTPDIANGVLRDQVRSVTLFTVQNTQGVTYLWDITIQQEGKSNTWLESARSLAIRAMTETIQIKSNRNPKANRYDAVVPVSKPPEPKWPNRPFRDLLKLAFGSNVIDNEDHPVVKRLLGITFD